MFVGIFAFLWLPVTVFMVVGLASTDFGEEEARMPAWVTPVMIGWFAVAAAALAAVVLMIRHLYTETSLTIGWKTAWTAILLLFNVYAAPVYWLRHFRKTGERDPHAQTPRTSGSA